MIGSRRPRSAVAVAVAAPEVFPMRKSRIVLLCLALPIAGLVLEQVWRGPHPAAARFAYRASGGGWVLFWSAVVLGAALAG